MVRASRVRTVPLDLAAETVAPNPGPAKTAEDKEMREKVLEAIRALPPAQREATTLFYIDGYSQPEIAEFLGVPVTTVQKRLHDSKRKLKERMLNMVGDMLKSNATDERFPRKVVAELLSRPKPLEIPDHPVRLIYDAIRAALPDYEEVDGSEVIKKERTILPYHDPKDIIHVDSQQMLRVHTTDTILQAVEGRRAPVRLITAGRVFRHATEDETHSKVFHQVDVLCIEKGADVESMKATGETILNAALDSGDPTWQPAIIWNAASFPGFVECLEAEVENDGRWIQIMGHGMLSPETLRNLGFDSAKVSGYAMGMGLERLAMMRYDIPQIGKLWQPPYVPA